MRTWRVVWICLLLCPCFSLPLVSQNTPASNAEGLSLLQRAAAQLVGGVPLNDIALSGTARRIAGSDDETGTVVLQATAAGAIHLDFSYPSGTRNEVKTADRTGEWTGPDGTAHEIAFHNLVNDAGLVPAITLGRVLSSAHALVTFSGQETHDGQSVVHLKAGESFHAKRANTATLLQHLSEMDIFLDSSTLLPVAIDFNAHPDNDAGLDIPVEIRFSDYRAVSGAQIPFHVQKYLNNGLILDLKFESAAVNSGIAPETFQLGAGR